MSAASGMQEALREVVGKEIMVVVISQCGFSSFLSGFTLVTLQPSSWIQVFPEVVIAIFNFQHSCLTDPKAYEADG